jgi:hypothetical protein
MKKAKRNIYSQSDLPLLLLNYNLDTKGKTLMVDVRYALILQIAVRMGATTTSERGSAHTLSIYSLEPCTTL